MSRRCRLLAGLTLAAFVVLSGVAAQAFAFVPNGTHGWYWQLPQPAGSGGMADLAFPTEKDVWSVGDDGLVLHSSDGGTTWAVQPTGTDADLWSVSFIDGLNGVTCGDAVLVTHDGGATWSDKRPAGDLAAGYTGVSAIDVTHFRLGTTDGAVLKTDDGGDTWQRLPLKSYEGDVACDFVDALHGWASGGGGRIWRTNDGGVTWSLQATRSPADTPVKIDFFDRHHGWALDYYTYWGEMIVRRTSDGGATWTRVKNAGWWVTDIDVTGPDSAWTVTSDWWWYSYEAYLQHTDDGGRHWQKSAFNSAATPTAIASNGQSVCAAGDGVLVSSDAGVTWSAASSGQQYGFVDASLVSASDIWAVEYNGAVLHSTDGVRWTEQDTPARWSTALYGVSFADADNGWLVGTDNIWGENGVILHTSDGGASWEPQTSNLGGQLVGVQFIDSSTGWAISNDPYPWGIGANTCLERTTDGGVTWIPLYVGNGAALQDLDFVDATTGWAVGTYEPVEGEPVGTIFKTVNGGFTWARQTLPKNAPLMVSVDFTSALVGWAVGVQYNWDSGTIESGWVLTTADGGKTWTRIPDAEQMMATSVQFSDPLHGWIGGDNGIFATTDGGASWQRVAGGHGITSIVAADPTRVWAFGSTSLLSTVDASGDLAAPTTLEAREPWTWSNTPVTVSLSATDWGGSGLASTMYKVDGGDWQTGTEVLVDAPSDHANDGEHTVYYRSTDNAGNREATEITTVEIDTLGPICSVPKKSVVDTGRQGILYFSVRDTNSGVSQVTLTIRNSQGRAVKRIVERARNWASSPVMPYFWRSFKCDLKPGLYGIEARAVDEAGNRQLTVGHNRLRVVRQGAPLQRRPDWPQGLPFETAGFGPNNADWLLDVHHAVPTLASRGLAHKLGVLSRP